METSIKIHVAMLHVYIHVTFKKHEAITEHQVNLNNRTVCSYISRQLYYCTIVHTYNMSTTQLCGVSIVPVM